LSLHERRKLCTPAGKREGEWEGGREGGREGEREAGTGKRAGAVVAQSRVGRQSYKAHTVIPFPPSYPGLFLASPGVSPARLLLLAKEKQAAWKNAGNMVLSSLASTTSPSSLPSSPPSSFPSSAESSPAGNSSSQVISLKALEVRRRDEGRKGGREEGREGEREGGREGGKEPADLSMLARMCSSYEILHHPSLPLFFFILSLRLSLAPLQSLVVALNGFHESFPPFLPPTLPPSLPPCP